jgi:hypothetical protein
MSFFVLLLLLLTVHQLQEFLPSVEDLAVTQPPSSYCPTLPVPSQERHTSRSTRTVAKYSLATLTEKKFSQLLAECEPFVIQGAIPLLTPQALLSMQDNSTANLDSNPTLHGKSRAVECSACYYEQGVWHEKPTTLHEYFDLWNEENNQSWQVRVSEFWILCPYAS